MFVKSEVIFVRMVKACFKVKQGLVSMIEYIYSRRLIRVMIQVTELVVYILFMETV